MAVMQGATLEDLDGLARVFTTEAERLRGVRRLVSSRLHGTRWDGTDSARFRDQWEHTHGPVLDRLAHRFEELHGLLLRQAEQQRSASSAGGGSGAGASGSWSAPGVLGGLTALGGMLGGPVAGGLGSLLRSGQRVRDLVDPWSSMAAGVATFGLTVGGGLAKYANSPVARWAAQHESAFAGLQSITDGWEKVAHPLQHSQSLIKHALPMLHAVDVGTQAYGIGESVAQGHYVDAGLRTGDLAAGELKHHGGVVPYLSGVALQSWVEVGRAAQQVDWSPQGMAALREASLGDWAGAFGESFSQMPGKLGKIFG